MKKTGQMTATAVLGILSSSSLADSPPTQLDIAQTIQLFFTAFGLCAQQGVAADPSGGGFYISPGANWFNVWRAILSRQRGGVRRGTSATDRRGKFDTLDLGGGHVHAHGPLSAQRFHVCNAASHSPMVHQTKRRRMARNDSQRKRNELRRMGSVVEQLLANDNFISAAVEGHNNEQSRAELKANPRAFLQGKGPDIPSEVDLEFLDETPLVFASL